MPDLLEIRRKAEKGSVANQGYLGWAYLYGCEIEINYQEALRWLTAAAYEGRAARPFVHLGRMYEHGLGVPRDIKDHNPDAAAFSGAVTPAEVEEARAYLRGRS
jgi:hypothetical protein